jgi:hypothetical protein
MPTATRFAFDLRWLLLFGLAACSSKLDLGHDLIVNRTPPDKTLGTPTIPDAGAPMDAAPPMIEASTVVDAAAPAQPLLAPTERTASVCVGIPCFAGPVLDLATSDGNARGIVMDADNVFWAATAGMELMQTSKDGSVASGTVTLSGGPFAIGADDLNVYFTSPSGGYVASTPKAKPRLGPKLPLITIIASGERAPSGILVASDGVYFSDEQAGTIKRVVSQKVETLVTGLSSAAELAVDAHALYYTDPALGEIHALDRLSKQDTLLGSGLDHPVAPFVSGDVLYFLELGTQAKAYNDGRLRRMPLAGGPSEVLVEQLDAPRGLAVDTAAVYLCTRGTSRNGYKGKIVRLSEDGQISTLAIDQAEPFAIAVDGSGVYWTTDADNALHAILR